MEGSPVVQGGRPGVSNLGPVDMCLDVAGSLAVAGNPGPEGEEEDKARCPAASVLLVAGVDGSGYPFPHLYPVAPKCCSYVDEISSRRMTIG